jgi:RNA polymerase sigma-70 factor (ECF subfamily)
MTEAELVRRARGGDEGAFRTLFVRYRDVLSAHAGQRLAPRFRRKLSTADLLQETFLAAFQNLDGFEDRGEGSFRAWLTKILDHRVQHHVRHYAGTAKRGARGEVTRGRRPSTLQFAGNAATPSQHAIAGEFEDRAERALAALPDDYREVLVLRQREHLTLKETAARMGRSVGAVNKLYARALKQLAEALDLEKPDGP